MPLLKQFIEYIQNNNLFQPKDKLLLAVSGGIDSIVLCELCKQAGFLFGIAHCNFQLRGHESDRDETFVKTLAQKYQTEVLIKKIDTQKHAEQTKKGIQETARILRYEWFFQLLQSEMPNPKYQYILTAHHANDAVETLLMNFFKGSGIKGLHGIRPKQQKLIRPLLFAKKNQLLAFAQQQNLQYTEDSSNATITYTRNYFRNKLIPDLQKVFPQVEENLLHNIQRFGEIELLYQQAVQWNKKKLTEQKGEEVHIPILKLLKTTPLQTMVYELVQAYGFTVHQLSEIIALLHTDSGKYLSSPTHRIIKNRSWLIIAPNKTLLAETILIEDKDSIIEFAAGKIHIQQQAAAAYSILPNPHLAQLDAAEITFPLLLRRWKQGDYFYPLGMNKKKKLSRFFIDQKRSLTEKENTWVVEMNKKIIWVVGMRIDERFKISHRTQNVLTLHLSVSK